MLGAGGIGSDEGQVDVGSGHAGQLNLCLLSSFLQTLHSHTVAAQVDAVLILEGVSQVVDDALIEVIAAQVVVTGSSQYLLDAIAHLNDGYIEGTAAQVVNHDLLVVFLINAISQGSSGGLVDDTAHIQAGNLTGILGGLTLSIGEVSRYSDNGLGNALAQVVFSIALELLQNHGRDLLRGVALAIDGNLVVGTHVTFDGNNSTVGVCNSLTLCNLTYHTLTGLGKSDNRRCGTGAFSVGDYHRLAAFHNGYTGVGSTQVDTNDLRHNSFLQIFFV